MAKSKNYPAEVKERAVRLVNEARSDYPSEWATLCSIAAKIGCSPETLRKWVRRAESAAKPDEGSLADKQRIKELERELREVKRANEILRKASAYFAQAELDRRPR